MKEDYNHLKYVAYFRRSIKANKTEEDKGVPSIESQKHEVRTMAREEGRKVVKEFEETITASEPGRPEFLKMISYLQSGKANAIICFKMDRLARNSIDEGIIKHMLQKGIIKNIHSTDRDWNTDDHMLIWSVEFGSSTQASRDLKKHIKRGQNEALRRGFRPGLAPMGYRNSGHKKQGMLEEVLVDEQNFPLLRKMFDYVLARNMSPFQVLKMAQDEWGFRSRKTVRNPNGTLISKASWYNILSNPFYYGEFKYGGEWHKGNHRKLISRAEFDEIQIIIGRGSPNRQHHNAYVGLMRCGECGARITCENKVKYQKNGNVHHYTYYHCTGQVDKDCSQKSISESQLEEQIVKYLTSIKISPSFHQWAIGELKKEYDRERTDKTTILYSQEREHRKVKQMLETLLEMRIAKDIDSETYQSKKALLEVEERRLGAFLETIDERIENWIYDAERVMAFSEKAVEKFGRSQKEQRREMLAALGTDHKLKNRELSIKTERPLHLIGEMVSAAEEAGKILEPPNFVIKHGRNGKKLPDFPILWRCGELNPGPENDSQSYLHGVGHSMCLSAAR